MQVDRLQPRPALGPGQRGEVAAVVQHVEGHEGDADSICRGTHLARNAHVHSALQALKGRTT